MKRLVICCDGTWNRPDSQHVTNVEKIARTVQIDSSADARQLVLYLSGVGVGYGVDRILGGAFGFGLFRNVLAGYRFLASNYEPGDEIYVFGFSRGAYTARSLCGMVGRVGLLTREALVREKLPEAVARYRRVDPPGGRSGQSDAEFKHDYCHPETPIRFLGVFDTVGALGVPGAVRRGHQFHDVRLGHNVECARQALAIDEPRMKFEPCLWEAVDGVQQDDRVRQAWFEGAHSDVGGGVDPTGLPDTSLLWMVSEASRQGLVFDESLLRDYVASGSSPVRHDPTKLVYRVLDLAIRTKIIIGARHGNAFVGRQRRLDRSDSVSVRIAESSADHYRGAEDYRPRNLRRYAAATHEFSDCVEATIALPEPSYDEVVARLAARGVSLGGPSAEPPAGGQSFPEARSPATESQNVS